MFEEYTNAEIRLAREIAGALNDLDSITLHLQYTRKYKEEFLRKVFNKVMAMDESQIKKSRAALYTYLINQSSKYDSRH